MKSFDETGMEFEAVIDLYEEYGDDWNSADEFAFGVMNSYQASELNTGTSVKNYISTTLAESGEEAAMRGVFELYEYWHQNGNDPNIPRVLFEYFLEQESTEGSNLDLQEIQAGLAFKNRIHLWEEFLAIAANPASYPDLDDAASRKWLRQTRAMKASMLRRQERLDEAQDLLAETLKLLEEDAARGDELPSLGFSYYEAGYLSFIIGEWDEALSFFARSSDIDSGKGDQVGGAISLCLEFRVRYLLGRVSAAEFSELLSRMASVFERNSTEGIPKHGHARRWVLNCWIHQLEIAVDTDDQELGSRAIEEIRKRSHLLPDESFTNFNEGMFSITQGMFQDAISRLQSSWNARTGNGDPARFQAAESKSQIPYLLGRAFQATGDRVEAERWLQIASDAAPRPGNHAWNARGVAALRKLRHPLSE